MLRFIVYLLLFALVLLTAASFASLNPGDVRLDLAFAVVETRMSVAFAVTFAIGWGIGLATLGVFAMKLLNDRRKLRKAIKLAEAEVSNLRQQPASHERG